MLVGFGIHGVDQTAATQVSSTSFISRHSPKNTATGSFPRLSEIWGSLFPLLETHQPANSGEGVYDNALGFNHCFDTSTNISNSFLVFKSHSSEKIN